MLSRQRVAEKSQIYLGFNTFFWLVHDSMRVISVDVVTIIPQCNKKKNRNPCIGRCQLLTGTNIYIHTHLLNLTIHTHTYRMYPLLLKKKCICHLADLSKATCMHAFLYGWSQRKSNQQSRHFKRCALPTARGPHIQTKPKTSKLV
jgi:hypothetical protein